MKHIMKCSFCKTYTLKEKCPKCNKQTIMPKPAKYSPIDKYADYRRQAKKQDLIKENLL
ncbi:MAG: RNA-protein complex protein Nop10 [Nanoarchaeota archaeon]|nr:RNA-protein complex protein Nop10 [Nanoarchaeota archaeon]